MRPQDRIAALEAEIADLKAKDAARAAIQDVLLQRMEAIASRVGMMVGSESEPVALLRQACARDRIQVDHAGTVAERDAAALLGLRPKTLKNRRHTDCPIPFVMRGSHPRYSLGALADHLLGGGKNAPKGPERARKVLAQ
jgi:hypothetical protein